VKNTGKTWILTAEKNIIVQGKEIDSLLLEKKYHNTLKPALYTPLYLIKIFGKPKKVT